MSAEAKKPDKPVHDGVQGGSDPIPKEPAGSMESRRGPSADGPGTVPDGPGISDGGADDPSGPAQEQDDASSDDRGLTTDLAPSD